MLRSDEIVNIIEGATELTEMWKTAKESGGTISRKERRHLLKKALGLLVRIIIDVID